MGFPDEHGNRRILMKRVSVLILVALLFACPRLSWAQKISIHLLDLSLSMAGNPHGNSLAKQIQAAEKGETFIVIGFGINSRELIKATMPSRRGPQDLYLKRARNEALQLIQEKLNQAHVNSSSTDLLGAIRQAARISAEQNYAAKSLYIYSDFLDTATLGMTIKDLFQIGSHKQYLKLLEKKGATPGLEGMKIYAFSFLQEGKEIPVGKSENIRKEIRAFWEEFFRRTKGDLVSWRTLD
jgi:hypothetical protein